MGNLDSLRAAAVLRLGSVPALAGVPVIPEDRMDIATEIQKALGQGGGLCLTVGTGSATCLQPGNPVPTAEVELVVEVAEIPPVNRAASGRKIPAISAAVLAVLALHHHVWEPGKTLTFSEIVYDKDDKRKLVLYTAIFKTAVSFEAALGD